MRWSMGDLAGLVENGSNASSKIKQLPLKVTGGLVPWTSRGGFSGMWEMIVSWWDVSGSIQLQRRSCCVILGHVLFLLCTSHVRPSAVEISRKGLAGRREKKKAGFVPPALQAAKRGHLLFFLGHWSSHHLQLKHGLDLFMEDGHGFWLCLAIHWEPTSLQMGNNVF